MTDAALLTPPPHVAAAEAPDYAGLLCARLCHDLISPAGAIGNGVELMRELGAGAGPELDLIGGAAGQLSAALAFLRLAFGTAGDAPAGLPAVQRTVRAWFAHQRPTLRWPDAQGEIAAPRARLLANLLQIAVSALPRGGEVAVETGPGPRLSVHAAGRVLLLPEGAEAVLAGAADAPAASAREIHWTAAVRHARACGARLALTRGDDLLTLSAA